MRLTVGLLFLVFIHLGSATNGGTSQHRRVHVKPGRHVCLSETLESRPIPVIQTYKKAVYTQRSRNCSHLTSCPQYDVSYVTATKTGYHTLKSGSFTHSCCPGWISRNSREKGCMQPICESGCGELGRCVQPGICECPKGFEGENCDIDVDECFLRDHNCHHFCVNTAGSYLCACQEGFSLAEDGKTCIYCYTCSREYVAMQQELQQIHTTLNESQMLCKKAKQTADTFEDSMNNITAQNIQLRNDVIEIQSKFNETLDVVESFRDILSQATTPTVTSTPRVQSESSSTAASSQLSEIVGGRYTLKPESKAEVSTTSSYISSSSLDDQTERTSWVTSESSLPTTESKFHSSTPTKQVTESETDSFLSTSEVPLTSTLPRTSTSSLQDSKYMPLFLYERFASLSRQIGILEERIGSCECREPPRA